MTPHKVTPTWWDHATMWNAADPTLQDAGHTTDGGRVFGITRVRYDECDHYGCRPVAVVDYRDREQVERLLTLYFKTFWASPEAGRVVDRGDKPREAVEPIHVEAFLTALREIAAPTPPKPDEPQGLGAVVEDAFGHVFIRLSTSWFNINEDQHCTWDHIAVVRVLNEGWSG